MASSSSMIRFPLSFQRLVGVKVSQRFREAVEVHSATLRQADIGPRDLLIRNKFVGVNASDINMTAGRYLNTGGPPPYPLGFEAAGEVVAIGNECPQHSVGDAVVYLFAGAYSEYTIVPAKHTIPIPKLVAEYVPLMVSGLTASLSLEKLGDLKKGEKVLVTAAAGGTGQFAVQLARLAGCHVIGTCSTDKKVEFLRSIGCHRPINYKREDLKSVLKTEYPNGVDVVYESIGGEVFNTCLRSLAEKGRLIVIGMISHYQQDSFHVLPTIPIQQILLNKSASMRGFLLFHFYSDLPAHVMKLIQLFQSGQLKSAVDLGQHRSDGPFRGISAIPDAVDYMYLSKNVGKIMVELDSAGTTSKL